MSRVPLVFLPSPYATWIGSHNITLGWIPLNRTDVIYIPQWTGPTHSGVWIQKEVRDGRLAPESVLALGQCDKFIHITLFSICESAYNYMD